MIVYYCFYGEFFIFMKGLCVDEADTELKQTFQFEPNVLLLLEMHIFVC